MSHPIIIQAVIDNDYNKVKQLLDSGVDVNSVDMYLTTPLHMAIMLKRDSIKKLLLSYGGTLKGI